MSEMFVLPPVDDDLGMTGLARAALEHGIEDAATDQAGHGPHSVRLIVRSVRALAVAEDHTDPDLLERIVITAALQNLADAKRTGDPGSGAAAARVFLAGQGADPDLIEGVAADIGALKFKGARTAPQSLSAAGRIVQDVVLLASLGAMGVAYAMSYGGAIGRAIYDPDVPVLFAGTVEEYLNQTTTSVNHLQEKAAQIPGRLNTATASRIAEARDAFMTAYLTQFAAEWEGRA